MNMFIIGFYEDFVMKSDLQVLKEMMTNKRSTGRTRRMVFEAARLVFLEGKTVMIVAKNNQGVREIEAIVNKHFHSSIANNIVIRSMDTFKEKLKTMDYSTQVLYDHFCFEKELLDLMEKYTMFDKEEIIYSDNPERPQGTPRNRMYAHHD